MSAHVIFHTIPHAPQPSGKGRPSGDLRATPITLPVFEKYRMLPNSLPAKRKGGTLWSREATEVINEREKVVNL